MAFLDSISKQLSDSLHAGGQKRRFGFNEEIFAEGDQASFLPLVLSGKVKMLHFLEPGKEVIVGIFEPGEMFALPPVFDGGKYPATAIAMEETELLCLGRDKFLRILEGSSEFSFAVIGWMSAMLREKTATIQNLATSSPEHRVGSILLKLAEKDAADPKISLRRQDIARMAGLTTETTIRAVRKLANKDLVQIIHGKIYIDRIEPLRRYLSA
jgi:CRP/FNR family transcriptional regulator